jgi:hypothetical protein
MLEIWFKDNIASKKKSAIMQIEGILLRSQLKADIKVEKAWI